MTDQIARAAEAATKWWTERLESGDRDRFRETLRPLVEKDLLEYGECHLECDYDPWGHLLTAVHAAGHPECSGSFFSARGILPDKHALDVYLDRMEPKEGYGQWRDPIPLIETKP